MFRSVPGVFRGVPWCSGVFRGVPGCSCVPVFRCSGVPGFSTCPREANGLRVIGGLTLTASLR